MPRAAPLIAIAVTATMLTASVARAEDPTGDDDDRWLSLGALAGFHVAAYTWSYFAWYRGREVRDHVELADEGWFGPDTYAGGADKLGHGFSNYAFVRGSIGLLELGGWDRRTSAIVSAGLTTSYFLMVELKDGLHEGYGFSVGDLIMNLGGTALGVAMAYAPRLDELADVRLRYVPTGEFVDEVRAHGVNVAEDYSGMTFQAVFHPGAVWDPRWMKWTDLVVGFESRGYLPVPTDPMQPREQRLYVGVAVNVQHALDQLWAGDDRPLGRRVVRGVSELFALPYTTVPLADLERSREPAGEPMLTRP
jgi:hypothetical protein